MVGGKVRLSTMLPNRIHQLPYQTSMQQNRENKQKILN